MSQNASVIRSENVEEESDEEDQEARDQCWSEEVRSRQGETEEQTQVEERTFHHQQGDGSQGTGDDANQEPREPHSIRSERKHRDRTEWTIRRSREHVSSTIVNAKVYSHGWGERVKINWIFQPCKSRQVTSQFGLIFLRRKMSTQLWSSLVMLQVNTSRVQSVQQNPSAEQQNMVGALLTHHPAWMSHHTGGSRQGHPRYTGAQQWEGRGWPDQEISQSAAHRHEMRKLFNRVMTPKCSKRRTRAMSTNDRWEKDDEFDKERHDRLHQRGAWSGQFDRWWEHDPQQVWRGEYHERQDCRGDRLTRQQKFKWGCPWRRMKQRGLPCQEDCAE